MRCEQRLRSSDEVLDTSDMGLNEDLRECRGELTSTAGGIEATQRTSNFSAPLSTQYDTSSTIPRALVVDLVLSGS